MDLRQRPVPDKHFRYLLLVHGVPVLIVIGLFWGMALLASIRHFANLHTDLTVFLALALIATVCGPVYTWFQIRNALRLVRSGMEVDGVISSVGRLSRSGMVRVDCRYTWRGRSYVKAWSETKGKYTQGDHVPLIVDRMNPARCMRKDDVFPEGTETVEGAEPDEAKAREAGDTWKWWYYILGGAGIGAVSVYLYLDLTAFEQSGGTRRVTKAIGMLYDLGGKWGVVGTLGALALLSLGVGVWEYWEQKSQPSPQGYPESSGPQPREDQSVEA